VLFETILKKMATVRDSRPLLPSKRSSKSKVCAAGRTSMLDNQVLAQADAAR